MNRFFVGALIAITISSPVDANQRNRALLIARSTAALIGAQSGH